MNSSAGINRVVAAMAVVALLAGCKTDLNQQLLERELRMQEDQIYRLQDDLHAKAARLERAVGENASLKRQLGISDGGHASSPSIVVPGGSMPGRPSAASPTFVPPPQLPKGATPAPAGSPPGSLRFGPAGASPLPPPSSAPVLTPPSLDGVPPLPSAGGLPPAVRRLSHEESLAAAGKVTHLVINPSRTECFDGDGDGVADGLALVIEPRDADERLVTSAGDMVVFVNDPAVPQGAGFVPATPTDPGEGGCIARWDIPEAEAVAHFRRTSRARGLHLLLRWPGPPPLSGIVNVHAVMTTFDGSVHHVDAPVPVRSPAAPATP